MGSILQDIEDVIFEVGEKYTNRKGDFTVLSIKGKKMKIEWDNGESIETTIEEQTRFIRNMEIERVLSEQKKAAKKKTIKKKKTTKEA